MCHSPDHTIHTEHYSNPKQRQSNQGFDFDAEAGIVKSQFRRLECIITAVKSDYICSTMHACLQTVSTLFNSQVVRADGWTMLLARKEDSHRLLCLTTSLLVM